MQCRTDAQSHAQFDETIRLCVLFVTWRVHVAVAMDKIMFWTQEITTKSTKANLIFNPLAEQSELRF